MPRQSPDPKPAKKPPAKPRRRSPGRPVAGTPDQRNALLDAAKNAFARSGYAGASLRMIATDAQVTPALAAYYFKDKTGLLAAVIDERVAPLVQALFAAVVAAGDDPLTQLQSFVRNYSATAARNPWLPQLIVREVLTEQGVLRQEFAQRFGFGLASRLREIVERAQRAGQIRALLASPAVVMSLISLCIFPFIATPLVSGVLGIRVDEAHVATLADHHWTLFLHGVEEAK